MRQSGGPLREQVEEGARRMKGGEEGGGKGGRKVKEGVRGARERHTDTPMHEAAREVEGASKQAGGDRGREGRERGNRRSESQGGRDRNEERGGGKRRTGKKRAKKGRK